MNKNTLQPSSPITLRFIDDIKYTKHIHEDIQLLYVIQGRMNITVKDKLHHLSQKDMIIINSNEKYNFNSSKGLFLGQFVISYTKISELLNQNLIYFVCNSSCDKNEAYPLIRVIVNQLLTQQLQKESSSSIYVTSLFYQLLHIITSNFLMTEKDIRFEFEKSDIDNRMQEILHFLRSNYHHKITLQDLSDKFFLSSTYLSKYIKIQ